MFRIRVYCFIIAVAVYLLWLTVSCLMNCAFALLSLWGKNVQCNLSFAGKIATCKLCASAVLCKFYSFYKIQVIIVTPFYINYDSERPIKTGPADFVCRKIGNIRGFF